ncbi:MAG: hypothetical protein ACE5RT_05235, partial [Nitrosopumilaceae archaeon]
LLSLLVIGALLIVTIPDSFAAKGGTPGPPDKGDPPGQGGEPPGGGGPPGGGTPPGQGGTPPGQGGTPPGQVGKDSGGGGGYSGVPTQFLGIGFYKIIPTNATNNAYSEFDETAMESRQIKFGDYFPYSKFSDITDSLNYGKQSTFQKHGQYFIVEDYAPSIPTLIGETNQAIQVQVRLLQPDDPTKIKHLGLYTDLNENRKGAYIIFDKENPVKVIDPDGIFKSVKVNTSLEDTWFWVIFDIVFEKQMPRSDIILEAWNERRIVSNLQVVDAWKIVDPSQLDRKTQDVTMTAQVEITHDASSPICKDEESCYTPVEAKVLEGGHVIWTNFDSFIHTVTSGTPELGPDDKFDGILMPGESFQVQFENSGVYRYYCVIHPWAIGMVNVYEDGQPSSEDEVPERELKIKSTRFGGSVLVENNDFVTSNKRTLTFDVSGHIEDEPGRKHIELVFTKPDGTKQKMFTYANNRGHYFIPIIVQNWEGGSYGITAKSHGEPIGSISFFLVDERDY